MQSSMKIPVSMYFKINAAYLPISLNVCLLYSRTTYRN
jgi:hypothetical protein